MSPTVGTELPQGSLGAHRRTWFLRRRSGGGDGRLRCWSRHGRQFESLHVGLLRFGNHGHIRGAVEFMVWGEDLEHEQRELNRILLLRKPEQLREHHAGKFELHVPKYL